MNGTQELNTQDSICSYLECGFFLESVAQTEREERNVCSRIAIIVVT